MSEVFVTKDEWEETKRFFRDARKEIDCRHTQITQEEMAKRWAMAFKPKQENKMSEASYQAMKNESQEWPDESESAEHLLTEYEWEEAKMFGQYEQKGGDEVIFFRHVDLSAYVSMMIYQRNKEKETGEQE